MLDLFAGPGPVALDRGGLGGGIDHPSRTGRMDPKPPPLKDHTESLRVSDTTLRRGRVSFRVRGRGSEGKRPDAGRSKGCSQNVAARRGRQVHEHLKPPTGLAGGRPVAGSFWRAESPPPVSVRREAAPWVVRRTHLCESMDRPGMSCQTRRRRSYSPVESPEGSASWAR